VLRKTRTSMEYHDFSHLPEAEAEAEMQALLRAERQRGFDVQRGPLLRARFFPPWRRRRGDELVLPSSADDGWCMGVLLRELFALAKTEGGSISTRLPEPFPLETYSRWRAQFDERAARAYWAGLLQDFSGPTGVAGDVTAKDDGDSSEFTEPQNPGA